MKQQIEKIRTEMAARFAEERERLQDQIDELRVENQILQEKLEGTKTRESTEAPESAFMPPVLYREARRTVEIPAPQPTTEAPAQPLGAFVRGLQPLREITVEGYCLALRQARQAQ